MAFNTDTFKAVFHSAFDKQRDFIRSPARRKALFVPRRGAKTYAIAIYMTLMCILHPDIKIRYLGLTRESAENALWRDCLLSIFNAHGIQEDKDYKYNKTTKTVEFSNKSTIQMSGADTSFKEPAKLLGGKYFMAIIDEAQHHATNSLEDVINTVIGPAVSDYIDQGGGQIIVAGTAGPYTGEHYWYQMTTAEDHLGWEMFRWDGKDNPHMEKQKNIEQQDFLNRYGPDYLETEWYRQQYLCEWIVETTNRIYSYNSNKCALTDAVLQQKLLLNLDPFNTKYVLSTDLGHNDACAFTLGAWHKYSPDFYVVKSEQHVGLSLEGLIEILKRYRSQYKPLYWPIDSAGSGKMIVEDYRKRYNIPFEYPKSKVDKSSYINMMNSDFVCSKIKVIEAENRELIEQWNTVLCDKKALQQGYRKEADRYKNDLCDSTLYAYSQAKHYWNKPAPPILNAAQQATLDVEKMLKKQTQSDRLKLTDDPFKY